MKIVRENEELSYENKVKTSRFDIVKTVLLASGIDAIGIVFVMIPNSITYGGVAGLSRLIMQATGLSYSLIYYFFSFAIMFFVWITMGLKELKKIVVMSIAYPTTIFLAELTGFEVHFGNETFLAAVMFGVIVGISNGFAFLGGFSSGGSDSIAKVIKYRLFPHLTIEKITFAIDSVIILITGIIMGVNTAIYAMISIFCAMKATEALMYGMSSKLVELRIITRKADKVSDYIIRELRRGVTKSTIQGGYSGEHKKQLHVICLPKESIMIKKVLSELDPNSFVAVSEIKTVWGRGRNFSDINEP